MISLTSIEDVVSKKINQLSKGYQKRVGLASVMIHDPKILILDEPTAGLDPNQVITFRKILRRFSEKKTIILSTHILSEIEATCERVIIIKNYSIVWNFHPHGAFAQDLRGLVEMDTGHLQQMANIEALSLDPCVAYEVELKDA